MGVGRFTPLRFTVNIKSILYACFWSYFLRYAYSRCKLVVAETLKDRTSRGGRVMPAEASDYS